MKPEGRGKRRPRRERKTLQLTASLPSRLEQAEGLLRVGIDVLEPGANTVELLSAPAWWRKRAEFVTGARAFLAPPPGSPQPKPGEPR